MGVLIQVVCTVLMCYLCIIMGIITVWPSSTVFIFTSNETTLNRSMSQTEVSLLGSLQSASALIGTAITGLLLDKLRRKNTTILFSLTFVIAWIMIAASKQVEIILTAIFISGLGSAVSIVVIVYASEICEDSIRSAMTACPIMFYGAGLMISYLLGGVLTYSTMVYVCLAMAFTGVVPVSFLKESPTTLVAKGSEHEGAKSIAFYRMKDKSSKEVLDQISRIKHTLYQEAEDIVNSIIRRTGDKMKQREKVSFCDYFICYLCIIRGIITVWPSSTVIIFTSNETTLNRPMSETEVSLFGSLQSASAVIGTAITGILLDKLGRKRTTILFSLTFVVAWIMIAASKQVEIILTAIFIGGLGSAIFMVVVVYVSEICEDSIRGAMTTCPIMFYGAGLMISYLLGGVLTYSTMVYVCLAMALTGVVGVSFMKESPTTLLAKGSEHEAAKSIAFYRMKNKSSREVLEEITKIRSTLYPEVEDIMNSTTKGTEYEIEQRGKVSFCDYFKKILASRKQLTVCLILISSYVLQGFSIVQVYLEPLFKEAVPSDVMSANLCSILTAILSVVSGIVSACLTDVLGRRPLIIFSSVITGALCVLIGTQTQLQWGPKWLSAVVIYLYVIFYTLGAGTIPYVIMAEVFLPEVKSMLSTLVMEWSWLCNFMMLYVFPLALSSLGISYIFYFFAVMSFATSIFCGFFLPETRGLSIDAIQKLFNKT